MAAVFTVFIELLILMTSF